jgi:hypothetical protein
MTLLVNLFWDDFYSNATKDPGVFEARA